MQDLLKLEHKCFNYDRLTKRSFTRFDRQDKIFKIYDPCKGLFEYLIGYIIFLPFKNSVRIYSMAVDPECRKQGIGRRLIEYVRHKAQGREIYLETKEINIPFYEKLGFHKVRKINNYYSDGEYAWRMSNRMPFKRH